MSLNQEKWDNEQCRAEEGIFFFNDEYMSLQRNSDDTFQVGIRSSIEGLINQNPDDWADLDTACQCSDEKYIALGGGGSLEGEGFIALIEKASKKLEWLLHLDSIELINQVTIEEGAVKAVGYYYPYRNSLIIPIIEPQKFSIIFEHEV